MPGLTIIIPAGDDVSRLEDTLAAVLRNRPRACEVIVAHAGTYADPYELASEVWFIELPTSSTREECLAQAIDKAAGDVIHVLSPGCEFDDDWWRPALAHFADASIGSVSPLVVLGTAGDAGVLGVNYGFRGRSEVAQAAAKILGPTHRAGFYRRTALKQIGGWPSALVHSLADVDVALSLRQLGYRAAAEPQSRICCTSAEVVASPYLLARQREQLYWRHAGAMSRALAIIARPVVATTECLAAGSPRSMLATVAGIFASLGDIAACRVHAARLQGLQRLTLSSPSPKSSSQAASREDSPRRAA